MASSPAPDQPPLDPDAFARSLDPFVAASGIVLAVSGGPDSICMMHMAACAARSSALPPLMVATVDHGLRAHSHAESDFVIDQARSTGLSARRLVWDGPKPARAVQEAARGARYALLTALCAEVGASHLMTAHTMDDQAETVLFRLLRGSGPAGLAGMRTVHLHNGVRHARPLLGFRKASLVAACTTHGWDYLTDPSNADDRYARTRLRRLLPLLAAETCDVPDLARLAVRAGRADAALRLAADRLLAEASCPAEAGCRRLDARHLAAAPSELAIRVLASVIADLGQARRIRLDALERLSDALMAAAAQGRPLTRTLHGAVLRLTSGGTLDIAAEGSRRRGRTAAGSSLTASEHRSPQGG